MTQGEHDITYLLQSNSHGQLRGFCEDIYRANIYGTLGTKQPLELPHNREVLS